MYPLKLAFLSMKLNLKFPILNGKKIASDLEWGLTPPIYHHRFKSPWRSRQCPQARLPACSRTRTHR